MPKPLNTADLPEDIAARAEARVAAGRHTTVEEVLRAGIEALEDHDEMAQEWLEYARFRFQQGQAAEARGEVTQIAPRDLMARIRQRIEKTL